MTFRQSTLLMIAQGILVMAAIVVVVACGDSAFHPPPIVLTFGPGFQPPASLNTGASAGIAVTVTNGPPNDGEVGFSCTPVGACGTFSPTSASSTIPVCYLAPDSVPAGNTVTVTATSASDNTQSISAVINIVNGAPNPCP
jgi:hypothetical protein